MMNSNRERRKPTVFSVADFVRVMKKPIRQRASKLALPSGFSNPVLIVNAKIKLQRAQGGCLGTKSR